MQAYEQPLQMLKQRLSLPLYVRLRNGTVMRGKLVAYDQHLNLMMQEVNSQLTNNCFTCGEIVQVQLQWSDQMHHVLHLCISSYHYSFQPIFIQSMSDQFQLQFFQPKQNTSVVQTQCTNLKQLQSRLKTSVLLLDYEQKRKKLRMKEIEYGFVNAYNHYLSVVADRHIILNSKDLIDMDEFLERELRSLKQELYAATEFSVRNKPPLSFLRDFMNYFPQRLTLLSNLIKTQIYSIDKIELTFESEYTLASKVLSHLKLNYKVATFCQKIFKEPLRLLKECNQELIVHFPTLYEKWSDSIQGKTLRGFINGTCKINQSNVGVFIHQFAPIYGAMSINQCLQLTSQAQIFAQNQNSIHQLSMQEQISETPELRLAYFVKEKLKQNRSILQSIVTLLIDKILSSFHHCPSQIKFIMYQFVRFASQKYHQLKFQDIKTFFNKVIFSQLFFAQFMRLSEVFSKNIFHTPNLSMVALLSQKVMFSQKYNQPLHPNNVLIQFYRTKIYNFISLIAAQDITQTQLQPVHCALISLQTLKFLYPTAPNYPQISQQLLSKTVYSIGAEKYCDKQVFVLLVNKPHNQYPQVLTSPDKLKHTLIQFLLLIDTIPCKTSKKTLFDLYKQTDKQSDAQLYAHYLMLEEVDVAAKHIDMELDALNHEIERTKIALEKEYYFVMNLERMHQRELLDKNHQSLYKQVENKLKDMVVVVDYEVVDNKVCQGDKNKERLVLDIVKDIAQYYQKGYQGTDGLYHHIIQLTKLNIEHTSNILGEILYKLTIWKKRDSKWMQHLEKHQFITLSMLGLKEYQEEVELIVEETRLIFDKLVNPHSPDKLLKIFSDVASVFTDVISISGKALDVNADVQIPLMILTIVKCKVNNLSDIIFFMQKYSFHQDLSLSALGVTFSLAKGALSFINNFDAKALSLTNQQYSSYLQKY